MTAYYSLRSSFSLKGVRNFVYVFILALVCNQANAQLSTKYTYTYTGTNSNAYNATPTILQTSGTVGNDAVFASQAIGFNFQFNCQSYTTCGISANGFIWFGTGTCSSTQYTPLSSTAGETGTVDGIISGFGCNLVPHASGASPIRTLNTKLTGVSPNQVFTIEWRKACMTGATSNPVDIQIKLFETTNKVEIRLYDNGYLISGTTAVGQVGMRGNSTADYLNRLTSGANNLCSSLNGSANTSTCSIVASSACYYASPGGTVAITYNYSFTGSCCTAPSTNATLYNYSNVVVNGVNSTADFGFTRGNGDGGVIVIAKAGSAPSPPSSGTVYSGSSTVYGSGTAVGGGFLVYDAVGSGSGTVNVSLSGLTNGVTYYIGVYEYNATATCYGPALSGNIPIPICAPPSIQASGNTVSNIQTTQADINWTGNGNGDDVIVFFKQGSAITTDPTQTTNYNANSTFGLGDQIGATGARAVYKGTGSSVTVTGLTTNITYFYAIYARNSTTNCYTVPPVTGSFTSTNSPMTTSAQVVTQSSVAALTPSSVNQQILTLRIDCGNGTAPALVMGQLFFTTAATNGGTTNPADIANAKVYFTGSSPTFAATTQYGSTVVSPNGAFVVSGATTLAPGPNYFWLTYDIVSSPTIGNFVDAQLNTIDIGAIITPSGDPAGNRQISLTYCIPSAMGGSPCGAAGNIYFSSASLSGTTFYSGGTCVSSSPYYANLSGSVIASAQTGTPYTLTVNSAGATSSYISTYAAWVDWDNNGTFGNTASEIIIPTNSNVAAGAPLTYTSASFVPPSSGTFRMRVAVWGGEFSNVSIAGPCTGSGSYYGEWKDFSINVQPSSTPMSYTSSTVVQNTLPVPPNLTNQNIVKLQVVTTGALSSISLTALTFNTNGSTSISTDATNARVFYTGINGTFSTATQFGSTIVSPNGSYTLTGNQTLAAGTNYFWVAYDVPASATLGNLLDAECTSIDVGGNTYTPSVTAPAGARPINLVYCVPSAGATGCSLGGDSWITTVSLTGVGSTFNFTGGTCLSPFPNNYQINPYSGNLDIGGNYTSTMIKGGGSYGARFIAWADWNNDADFTDAGEMIMDVTQNAASATGTSFTVPLTALPGGHRLRTWIGYTGTIVASNITSVITGCEVLPGSNNQGEIRDFTLNLIGGCTPPVIGACPGAIEQCDNTIATWTDPSATGTTPTVVCAPLSGSSFAIGTTAVTCTATNACGSSSCSFSVTINESPVIGPCPSDITSCNPVVTFATPSATGTPAAVVNCSPASGSTFSTGITAVTCTAVNGCGSSSCSFNVEVQTSSVPATGITSNAAGNEICLGNNITLTLTGGSLGQGAVWSWYEGGCGTGALLGTGTSFTVTPATSGIHTYYVRAEGTCNTTLCASIAVNVKTLPPAGTIHLTSAPVEGCVGNTATISVNAVATATFYRWNCATGGILFNGQPGPYDSSSPTVTITYTALPVGGGSGWSICVFPGNACGNSNTICAWIRATLSRPAAITGSVIGCPNTSSIYSCSAVTGAASYQWNVTGDATITNNGNQTITVNFGPAYVGGTLCVHSQTSCGYNSADLCMTISTITAMPGVISGPSNVCPNASSSFSIPAVTGATSYQWTTSVVGAVVTGTGTTCSILFPTTIPGGATVCVRSVGPCGIPSAQRCKGIATGLPGVPSNIVGPTSGRCGASGVSYSITPVANATSYLWTANNGATISGPNNISAISVDFPAFFTSAVITVYAINACGNGGSRSLTVTAAPSMPASISGSSAVCNGQVDVYSTTGSSGATAYVWTVPANSQILGGQNSATIVVLFGATSGNITVKATNACGISPIKSYPVSIVCRESQVTGSFDQIGSVIYPNPTTGMASIRFSREADELVSMEVYDITGRILMNENISAVSGINLHEIDLSSFAKGVYIIGLKGKEMNEMLKITVE